MNQKLIDVRRPARHIDLLQDDAEQGCHRQQGRRHPVGRDAAGRGDVPGDSAGGEWVAEEHHKRLVAATTRLLIGGGSD